MHIFTLREHCRMWRGERRLAVTRFPVEYSARSHRVGRPRSISNPSLDHLDNRNLLFPFSCRG